MAEKYTDAGVYIPNVNIVLACSFEGYLNNGQDECGGTSYNIHVKNGGEKLLEVEEVTPKKYLDDDSIRKKPAFEFFRLMRPFVEVAEDYFTVWSIFQEQPGNAAKLLANPDDKELYLSFGQMISDRRASVKGTELKTQFYDERKRLKELDPFAWNDFNDPFPEAKIELLKLVETQERENGNIKRGFIPGIATSKDEKSIKELCVYWEQTGKMARMPMEQDGGRKCVILENHIIGMETVPSRDKVEELVVLAKRADVSHDRVWRINDRMDKKQQKDLLEAGFVHQFVIKGGYASEHHLQEAENDDMVIVLEKENHAQTLGQYAKDWGL
jgi:hypothetical protein